MNNRISNIFTNNKKKLISFVTGGDPDFETSNEIIENLAISGADIIEIGMPFSDPMADGPTIQLSSLRAIQNGADLNMIFNICKNFRKKNNITPLILMGYYNVIYHFGIDNFIKSCESVGVDGLIIVDLQPEEDSELIDKIQSKNIDLIRLVTPTTNIDRLITILKNASGFLYYVTITGITGQQSANIETLRKSIQEVKKFSPLPVVAGFGIKNATQAKEVCSFSDGVVVGSSIVKIIEDPTTTQSLKEHTSFAWVAFFMPKPATTGKGLNFFTS
jgi:tryptophan synthase alpha chain